jgi:predicted acyl esterase
MTGATLAAARSGSHSATASAAADTALRAHARQSSAAQRTLLVGSVCLWQVSNLAITTIFVLEAVLRVVQKGFVLGKHTYL